MLQLGPCLWRGLFCWVCLMTLALDFPACNNSPLGRLDPRWKLAALMLAALATALLQMLPTIVAASLGTLVLVPLSRLPPRWLLLRLCGVALVMTLFLAWLPFVHPQAGPSWHVGWITLAPAGVHLAVLLLVKALVVVTLMLILLATSPLQDTCKAAHALHFPGVLVQLVLLTYRFVFLVAEEFSRLRIALRVRGFRNRGNWQSYHTIGQVAGTLLVRGHDRAERVGQAMRCRGFDGTFRSLHTMRTRLADMVAFGAIAGLAVTLVAWDFAVRP